MCASWTASFYRCSYNAGIIVNCNQNDSLSSENTVKEKVEDPGINGQTNFEDSSGSIFLELQQSIITVKFGI